MRNLRKIQRHQLPSYLQVYNRITDKPMGCLGNVSQSGLMLISDLPMLVGACFDMRIKLPSTEQQEQLIDFSAVCKWSKEDVTPGHFDSGFSLAKAPLEYLELVETLRIYFSFYPLMRRV